MAIPVSELKPHELMRLYKECIIAERAWCQMRDAIRNIENTLDMTFIPKSPLFLIMDMKDEIEDELRIFNH